MILGNEHLNKELYFFQADPETVNKVSESVTEKLTSPDCSATIVDSSVPLTAEGKKNDCSMDGGAGGNLFHEMGAQMDVFEVGWSFLDLLTSLLILQCHFKL